jgi:signal transduction histidine kinase
METKGISFTTTVSKKVIIKHANRDLLFQLFYNLINNATRYNKEQGSITLHDHYAEEGPYQISVKDSGIGIRKDELSIIFNRFKRSGQADGEGYGLGLSIVKSIVQYHDAEIEVKSELRKGTEFTVIFPAEKIQGPKLSPRKL